MIPILLCIALLVVPFSIILVQSHKDAAQEKAANRLVDLNPIPHNGQVEYVYTRSYMEAMRAKVEHDINGYFDK